MEWKEIMNSQILDIDLSKRNRLAGSECCSVYLAFAMLDKIRECLVLERDGLREFILMKFDDKLCCGILSYGNMKDYPYVADGRFKGFWPDISSVVFEDDVLEKQATEILSALDLPEGSFA